MNDTKYCDTVPFISISKFLWIIFYQQCVVTKTTESVNLGWVTIEPNFGFGINVKARKSNYDIYVLIQSENDKIRQCFV